MDPIITPLLAILASRGIGFLSDLVKGATDEGIQKTKEFIETRTGIPLVDGAGEPTELSEEQIQKIVQLVTSKREELESLLVRKMELDAGDTKNARDLQSTALSTALEVTKTGDDFAIRSAWFAANFIYIYALVVTTFIFLFMFLVTFLNIPQDKAQYVNQIISTNSNLLLILVSFFFGGALGMKYASMQQRRRTDRSGDAKVEGGDDKPIVG